MISQLLRSILALSSLLLPLAWSWTINRIAVVQRPAWRRQQHDATAISTPTKATPTSTASTVLRMSDWASFEALDDDDDDLLIDTNDYAEENDSQEYKAQVGASLEPPEIDDPRRVPAIQVPAGSQLELDEDTVLGVMSAMRQELGTLFGYQAENRGVGITGGVDYVELDGPCVIVRLKGRFWHQRTTVLDRVANYLQQRIPEIIEVSVEDPWQLTDEANEVW